MAASGLGDRRAERLKWGRKAAVRDANLYVRFEPKAAETNDR
ncbi:hypothetical protein N183_37775 [Sinorhizobium sp. Sb3]|nr:hypothetical protein N183_37775 [Sinorhizobium sp. Sb3]